jgi:hypothetical protein
MNNNKLIQIFNKAFVKRAAYYGLTEKALPALYKIAGNGALLKQLMNTAGNVRNIWPGAAKANPAAYNKMHDTYDIFKTMMNTQGLAPRTDAINRRVQADWARLLKQRVNRLNPSRRMLNTQLN